MYKVNIITAILSLFAVLFLSCLVSVAVAGLSEDRLESAGTLSNTKVEEISDLVDSSSYEEETEIKTLASESRKNVESNPELVVLKSASKSSKSKTKSLGVFKLSAYCGCSACCGSSSGKTASGTTATEGRTIAADTSVLPMGTKVIINGHEYTVEDRGGSISGNRIDVYFSSHSEALAFGVQYAEVYVVS